MIRMGTIMNFQEMLLEMLLEGKLEDTLGRHPTIPDDVKQNYLKQIPAQNAQHLDWVLSQHTKGNITSSHDINGILDTFNKVKDKLPKKQIHQYDSIDELHAAITPHQDNIKKSDNEKRADGTETLYSSSTMTIRQHHNYESTVSAASLPKSNISEVDKAKWCVSVGDGGGASHHSKYTDNGFHPVYTIEHRYPDGSSSKHMMVYDYNKKQGDQELRNEEDYRPGFSDYNSTRPDLLNHYSKVHPELMKTPIAHLFSEAGREQYKKEAEPKHQKLKATLANIPTTGMSDDEYMSNFKEGQEKQQGGIHNKLAKLVLSPTQLTHLIEHGNKGSMHEIAQRQDLSEPNMQKLANSSNMAVHHFLLSKPNISDTVFNTIIKKAHFENIPTIINHPKFNETHLDAVLNKKISDFNLTPILQRLGNKLEAHHITKIIDKGNDNTRTVLLSQFSNKLDKNHISTLIDKGKDISSRLHDKLINTIPDKLESNHISEIISKGDSYTREHLIDKLYDKFEPHHITALKDSGIETKYVLENRVHDKLEPHEISRLIGTGDSDVHNKLFSKIQHKLEPHLKELIDKGDSNTHNKIMDVFKDKLDSTHISSLIDKGNKYTHDTLLSRLSDKLKPHHIQELIDKNKEYIDTKLIHSLSHKLEPLHIKSMIENSSSVTHHDLLNHLNHKLDSDHISTFIDKTGLYTNHTLVSILHNMIKPHHISALIDKKDEDIDDIVVSKLHHKLEPKHIKALVDNGSGSLIKRFYQKLSPESKDEFSLHEQSLKDGRDELKEWYFTNSNFERLIQESLIT